MKDGYPGVSARADATGLRVAIVAARFNQDIVGDLLQGALDALVEHGAKRDAIDVCWVPGAFELPVVLGRLAASGRYDALVGLAAVIRGDTPHFEFVAGAAATGMEAVAREHGVPVGFGVLTTDDVKQARARAGGAAGNKGAEAALTAVETARVLEELGC